MTQPKRARQYLLRYPKVFATQLEGVPRFSIRNFPSQASQLIRYDHILLFSFVSCSIIFLGLVAVVAFHITDLPPYLPLWYSLRWGQEQLIPVQYFILLPLLILGLFVFDVLLGLTVFYTNKIATRLLFLSSALFALLLAITVIKIVFLVI